MQIANELKPPLAAISGGLGDIGQAIAKILSDAGAEIALADLGTSDTTRAGTHFFSPVDVTDAAAVEKWYGKVSEKFGRVPNLIVPNAAIATFKPYLELTAAEWKRELDVNLNGAFYFADAGTRRLVKESKPGRVVFMGSWAGHAPHGKLPAYSVAKAGLRMLNQTLALELAPRGILVNEIAPGYVHAGLSGRVFTEKPEIAVQAQKAVPIRKLISAEDVAMQVLYLCSPAGNHITGTTILQDGGLSLVQGPIA